MIIVTGAAGFIGYNIAKRLNLMGREDLILIDNKKKYPNPKNFNNLRFKEYRHFLSLENLENITCIFVRQNYQLGLGHAVLCAEKAVGNEPFAVLLADDLIFSSPVGKSSKRGTLNSSVWLRICPPRSSIL